MGLEKVEAAKPALPTLWNLFQKAMPVARGTPEPTTADDPRFQWEESGMCMLPPSPFASPCTEPNISANISAGSLPRHIVKPWHLWVGTIQSPSSNAAQSPACEASCPLARWVVPCIRPALKSCSVFSSKNRESSISRRRLSKASLSISQPQCSMWNLNGSDQLH